VGPVVVAVPLRYVTPDGFRLGGWIAHQRHDKRAGTLPSDRVAALDALGLVWEPVDEDWRRGLAAAQAYRNSCGDLRVPFDHVDPSGFRLGRWISHARDDRRAGRLAPERIAQLDALDMVWEPLGDDWQRWIAAARRYRERHGNLRVPRTYITEDRLDLGSWISSRRRQKRSGTLSAERIAELDAIGMVWDPFDDYWQRCLGAANLYRSEHGDLRVPRDYLDKEGSPPGLLAEAKWQLCRAFSAPRVGLEPTTLRLTAGCSAN
jgi:hypothetical protein